MMKYSDEWPNTKAPRCFMHVNFFYCIQLITRIFRCLNPSVSVLWIRGVIWHCVALCPCFLEYACKYSDHSLSSQLSSKNNIHQVVCWEKKDKFQITMKTLHAYHLYYCSNTIYLNLIVLYYTAKQHAITFIVYDYIY